MTRVLGAVLAGGQSRRFGSDKALVIVDGVPLIEHALAALAPECDDVVLCGRAWKSVRAIADVPAPGLGPLAGLCAALRYAETNRFNLVLCVPVDVWPLPAGLKTRLGKEPAVFSTQWTIGLWPAHLAEALSIHIGGNDRSLRSWVAASGARYVSSDELGLCNINSPADLMNDGRPAR